MRYSGLHGRAVLQVTARSATMSSISLSRTERWILLNQFEILSLLDEDNREHWKRAITAVEFGFESEYSVLSQRINEDTLSRQRSKELVDILSMFEDTQHAAKMHATSLDQSEVAVLTFRGLGANDEGLEKLYVEHYCSEAGGRFTSVVQRQCPNSHMPMLPIYRRQLKAYADMTPNELSAENLKLLAHVVSYEKRD